MTVRQIKEEKIISTQDLDKRLAARDAAVKTVDVSNLPDGFQPGETIEINQKAGVQDQRQECRLMSQAPRTDRFKE
jgi:hypothetical protein